MPFSFRWLLALGTISFPFPQLFWSAVAQNSVAGHAPLPTSNLRLLTRSSGYIFDGTVLSVEREGQTESGTVAAVRIAFRVDQAIRGVRKGQVLTIREWAGLWNSGERYRSGEHLLLFLYSPSKLGLTSPVGGSLGRFAVDSGGNVILDNAGLAGPFPSHALTDQKSPPNQISLDPASRAKLAGQNRVNSRALALAVQRLARE
jgi:hypothetical protein